MNNKNKKVIFNTNFINYLKRYLIKNNFKKIFIVRGNNSYYKSKANVGIELINKEFEFIHFDRFSTNPRYTDALVGAKIFIQEKCDCIISIGGGSTIDMGKLINIFQSHQGKEKQITLSSKKIKNILKPFIAIPTTSGSGSECTHFAVIYLRNKKYSIANKNLVPDLALVDYSLTLRLPKYETACSGMDAMSQSIESYWSVNSNIESRRYARKSIRLIIENLINNVNNPSAQSRKNMMIASHLSGKAINITKTTAPHALSYKISQVFKIPHGHAVATTLGHFFELNHLIKNINSPKNPKELLKQMESIYKYLNVISPEQAKNKWFNIMKELRLESDFKKLFKKNNRTKLLTKRKISYIVKSVNLERLKNHPVILSRKDLESVFQKEAIK